jgi:hypothetical protein
VSVSLLLGLDIGGANLKAAHVDGTACSVAFPLWKDPGGLAVALRDLIRLMPAHDLLAVTMTGELCDCFETKRQGVETILDAVREAAGTTPVQVWQTTGRFVSLEAARADHLRTAAANWSALAVFAGRFVPAGPALLIDIGSTTTDIIPLLDGKPVPRGFTDLQRLGTGELVYTGARRTPVCALLGAQGAAELFATTLDVYLILGMLPENQEDCDTADGRPATRAHAHARLARMLCADVESCSAAQRIDLAEKIHKLQLDCIRGAVRQVCAASLPGSPRAVIVSGSGEVLGRQAAGELKAERIVSLAEELGPEVSRAACAYALAKLVGVPALAGLPTA